MKTLLDKVYLDFHETSLLDFDALLTSYGQDKYMAKSFSIFSYLVARGYNASTELAEKFAETMEAFFLATSIHDDVIDSRDDGEKALSQHSLNTRIVFGDYFFIQLAVHLAEITQELNAQYRKGFLDYFKREMVVVAESQLIDQRMAGKPYTIEASLQQAEERGGSWGRLVMGSVCRALGAPPPDVRLLSEAANDFFIALTILDDLQDLTDDIANGIYSLAPSHYAERHGSLKLLQEARGSKEKIKRELDKTGSIKFALETASHYAAKANQKLDEFLRNKEGMYWFQMKAFFNNVSLQLNNIGGGFFAQKGTPTQQRK